MVNNMIGGMLLMGVFLMILGIAQIAFFVWAIVEIILFNKKVKEQTLKIGDVKRASMALPLGLNILGLILFFVIVKPAIKNDPTANKKANLFCWLSYIIFTVLSVMIYGLTTINTLNTVKNITNETKPYKTTDLAEDNELFDKDKIKERTRKAKNAGKFIPEEGVFAIKAKGCDNFTKQNNSDNSVGYICASSDSTNNTINAYIIGYTDTDENYEDTQKLSNEELIHSAINGVGGNFSKYVSEEDFKVIDFKGSRAVEGNISHNSQYIKILALPAKKDKSGKTRAFFIAIVSNNGGDILDNNFMNFADSFERL